MAGVDVKRILQEVVVPDLQGIKTDLATVKVDIKRLDEKVDGVGERLNEKIDGVDRRLNERMDGLDGKIASVKEDVHNLRADLHNLRGEFRLAIDIHERLAFLEAKIGR